MKIALINASPKKTESASGALLEELKRVLTAKHDLKEFRMDTPSITEDEIKELLDFSVWVFAFPLYVDGVPSHMLSCLCMIEKAGVADKDIHVYAIANCGFFEGTQNRNSLAIMENWCRKSGLTWGMGIGYGGGGGLLSVRSIPLGKGSKASLGKAYATLVDAIESLISKENFYASFSFPRLLYKIMGELGWRRLIKANGGKPKDLDKRL